MQAKRPRDQHLSGAAGRADHDRGLPMVGRLIADKSLQPSQEDKAEHPRQAVAERQNDATITAGVIKHNEHCPSGPNALPPIWRRL